MIQGKRTISRYLVWGLAFAFCGGLIGVKTVATSPGDVLSGFAMGGVFGFAVAACINISAALIGRASLRQNVGVPVKSKRVLKVTVIALLVALAIWVWVYAANTLLVSGRAGTLSGASNAASASI